MTNPAAGASVRRKACRATIPTRRGHRRRSASRKSSPAAERSPKPCAAAVRKAGAARPRPSWSAAGQAGRLCGGGLISTNFRYALFQPCVLLLKRFDCAPEQKHVGGFPSWNRQRVRWLLLVNHDEGVPPHEAKTPHPETFLCR